MQETINRFRTPFVAFLHDLALIPLAWFGAYWLRYNLGDIPDPFLSRATLLSPWIILIQGGLFWYFGLYRGVWRFASIPDLVRIFKAVLVGVLMSTAVVAFFTQMEMVPRSVFPIYAILLLGSIAGPRFLYRWMKDYKRVMSDGEKVLIIGAGRAGENVARDLLRTSPRQYKPVGFIDDDQRKKGCEIHGIPVLGNLEKLHDLVTVHKPDLILIAAPSSSGPRLRRIVEYCESVELPFRTLPKLDDLLAGKLTLNQFREVSIEDLLGRDQVELDWGAIDRTLHGRVVLVTGGGGSIGSELCRKIAIQQPARLAILDNSEFNLYSIEKELQETFPDLPLSCRLVDVSDVTAVNLVMDLESPTVVFHAAAYKHVPMLENQIREAMRVNVLGSRTVAQAAADFGVETFVMISTDKAVNPTNVMGASKRMAEIFVENLDRRSDTHFVTVRFGNVLGSAGSVVPLFRRQIREGGPITVTHPEVKRYFMTIPEASQLILQASAMGSGGEIYVLDMGQPIKITYLAEQMIRLSGKVPGDDIEIKFTGLRPGEKLFEELFHEQEQLRPTEHKQILLARHRCVEWDELSEAMIETQTAVKAYKKEELLTVLKRLVPEYRNPNDSESERPSNVLELNSRVNS